MEHDDGVTSCACQCIGIRSGFLQYAAPEEVFLSFVDLRAVLHLDGVKNGSLYLEREGHGAVASASRLRQGIARHLSIDTEFLAPEQISLSRLDRGGIGCCLRRTEGKAYVLRTIVVGAGALRRSDGRTAKEVLTAVADGRRILRVRVGEGSSAQERQQG